MNTITLHNFITFYIVDGSKNIFFKYKYDVDTLLQYQNVVLISILKQPGGCLEGLEKVLQETKNSQKILIKAMN